MDRYEFVGCTQICAAECCVLISGAIQVAAMLPPGGDPEPEQYMAQMREKLGTADMKAAFNVRLEVSEATPAHLFFLPPPGMYYVLLAEKATMVRWSCGARSRESREAIHKHMNILLTAFPQLRKTPYGGFSDWLVQSLE